MRCDQIVPVTVKVPVPGVTIQFPVAGSCVQAAAGTVILQAVVANNPVASLYV